MNSTAHVPSPPPLALAAFAFAFAFVLALSLPLDAEAADNLRFKAEAALVPAQRQISANARFELTAALSATPHDAGESGGRFELRAKLVSNATTGACGPLSDNVFSNGFE
jgi:hypothetical protein